VDDQFGVYTVIWSTVCKDVPGVYNVQRIQGSKQGKCITFVTL